MKQEQKTLELALCSTCATEILEGDVVIWGSCLLCSARAMKAALKEARAEVERLQAENTALQQQVARMQESAGEMASQATQEITQLRAQIETLKKSQTIACWRQASAAERTG